MTLNSKKKAIHITNKYAA